jgi:hypothetical protein
MLNQKAAAVAYKVLLLPVRAGEPLPVVTYDAPKQTAQVAWQDQTDVLTFSVGADKRTQVEIKRGGENLLP